MRGKRAVPFVAAGLAVSALGVAALVLASGRGGKAGGDRYWVAPDFAEYPVHSIALLPPATYDDNADARKLVEYAVGQALKGAGFRWVSPFLVRDYLIKPGRDSLAKAIQRKLLLSPRLDSLDAPLVSRVLRARAILSVRVDRLERMLIEAGQSGRPSTSVELSAALVDSTGRLLWTAHSSETVEGAQQEAEANVIGVKVSGLNNEGIGNTTSAPPFPEVVIKVCLRWADPFPKHAAADTSGTGR